MRRVLILCSLLLAAATACGDDEVTTTEVTITEAAPPPSSAEPASSAGGGSTEAGSTAAATTAQETTAEPTTSAETPTTDEDPIDGTTSLVPASTGDGAGTDARPGAVEPASDALASADELEAFAPRAEEMPPGFTLNEDGSGQQAYEDFAAGEDADYLAVVDQAGWVGSYSTSYVQGQDEAVEVGTTAIRDEDGTKAVFDAGIAVFEERVGIGVGGEAVELANVGDEARGYVFTTTTDGTTLGGWAVLWRQGNVLGSVFVGSLLPEGEPPREEYRPYAAGLANATAQRIAETLAG